MATALAPAHRRPPPARGRTRPDQTGPGPGPTRPDIKNTIKYRFWTINKYVLYMKNLILIMKTIENSQNSSNIQKKKKKSKKIFGF